MILLKEKADKDLQQHNAEMKELVRVIDHDRKLKEFMGVKGQERQEDPQLVAWRQKRGELIIKMCQLSSIFIKHVHVTLSRILSDLATFIPRTKVKGHLISL